MTAEEFTAALERETDRSLRNSPERWRYRSSFEPGWSSTNARAGTAASRGESPHGRRSTYVHGCRCRDCRDAATQHQRIKRARARAS